MQLSSDILRQCWFLAGPTACGKSETGVELALRLGGREGAGAGAGAEIISMDSMSLYRGMDIGTAKPSRELRERVPHHLVDVLDPHEEYSVAAYLAAAADATQDILSRGRIPLFVGGTGLYLRSLLRGVFEGPPADAEFRRSLEAEAARTGVGVLHSRLRGVDPVSAARIDAQDLRRIIRALEVEAHMGRPLSELQRQPPLPADERPRHVFWLSPPRSWLYERINRRVERMFSEGLVEEVERLLQGRRPLSRTARQALGYKEVIDFLEGRTSLPEAVEKIQTRTRQFAKRQHTWFRHLEECRPVEIAGDETPSVLADRLIALRS